MDRRTKRQKLEAMANQTTSPHEAEIAKQKLAELPAEEPQPSFNDSSVLFQWTLGGQTYRSFKGKTFILVNGQWVEYFSPFKNGFSFTFTTMTASYTTFKK